VKHLICLVIVFAGCTPMDFRVDNAQKQLILTETKFKTEAERIRMCEERAKHSAKCAGKCVLSSTWHKKQWN